MFVFKTFYVQIYLTMSLLHQIIYLETIEPFFHSLRLQLMPNKILHMQTWWFLIFLTLWCLSNRLIVVITWFGLFLCEQSYWCSVNNRNICLKCIFTNEIRFILWATKSINSILFGKVGALSLFVEFTYVLCHEISLDKSSLFH